jgi:hypothetical protein
MSLMASLQEVNRLEELERKLKEFEVPRKQLEELDRKVKEFEVSKNQLEELERKLKVLKKRLDLEGELEELNRQVEALTTELKEKRKEIVARFATELSPPATATLFKTSVQWVQEIVKLLSPQPDQASKPDAVQTGMYTQFPTDPLKEFYCGRCHVFKPYRQFTQDKDGTYQTRCCLDCHSKKKQKKKTSVYTLYPSYEGDADDCDWGIWYPTD